MTRNEVQHSSLLLEIGTEDIPARFLPSAIQQLKENTETIFKENHIRFSAVKTLGSPRRLAVIAAGIPPMQEDRVKEIFGPSKKAAFDTDGRPTKAAAGFARSQGISIEKLIVKKKDKGEYVAAVIEEKGIYVRALLPEILKKIVFSVHLPKSMRWGGNDIRFIRPIRWLLSLFDNETISFEIDGIKSGNMTRGHRFLSPAAFQIKEIPAYTRLLANNHVIVDPLERRRIMTEKAEKLSSSINGKIVKDEELIETVSNLVEYPAPVLGSFPQEYLRLPKELLITVMREHQKYFAIEDIKGVLTNYFIIISNTAEQNSGTVNIGAERVIKARFEDAKFYFEEDCRKKLEDRINSLKNVVYQEKLGTLYEKALRVKTLTSYLASKINVSLMQKVERAALLSKTDLLTGVVREFPELQGIIGKYYATNDNEDAEVSTALMEQYLPAFHGDRLPETETGAILSLADKLDNITSFFSIGLIPTGSEDPFALRRQTFAVIAILLNKGYALSLKDIVDASLKNLKGTNRSGEIAETALRFFEQRLEPLFLSEGYGSDIVQSVLHLSAEIPLKEIRRRLQAVKEFKETDNYNDFLTAIKRVKNITPAAALPSLKGKLLHADPEKKLHEEFSKLKTEIESLIDGHKYSEALRILSGLTAPINHFFDKVLVMDKREEIKLNRLALLKGIWTLASSIADFSKLQ
ncbi:MAG: glycine--tRNA ligase subunit beta [Thermodesulfovibrionales bacterium]|nr:glycine--tRNA ligase subunit beta [Thermodesulfovibrionales bacterium]